MGWGVTRPGPLGAKSDIRARLSRGVSAEGTGSTTWAASPRGRAQRQGTGGRPQPNVVVAVEAKLNKAKGANRLSKLPVFDTLKKEERTESALSRESCSMLIIWWKS